jgi:pimeloyl-ACP methyl ester carboxylesterase
MRASCTASQSGVRGVLTFSVVVLIFLGLVAGIVAFDSPRSPLPMTSVARVFDGVDFSDMPSTQTFAARDGTQLLYRHYRGASDRIVVLVHGSSGTSASMHAVARAIHQHGATVYALAMRGHEGTGRSGDINYIGQLDDDLVDFVETLGPRMLGQRRTLLGFSSGGGFALRFAGGSHGAAFDRLVLVAPQLPHDAPTSRPAAGGWVSVAIPRIMALSLLERIGITMFGGLPVLAMAVDPARAAAIRQTPVYSFRMQQNFGARAGYLDDVRRVSGDISLFVGGNDEIFRAEKYAPHLQPVRPDLKVVITPGLTHMEMTVKPTALEALAGAV